MKILHIRLKNLNSLNGTWHIDFTDPAYTENNLFAITGPTGAGKSTILDGVCLALYGQTPRLGRISKSSNEIMSRHSGICFAEVEFQTVKGCFRCHWSQHRSRQKANGELQQPRHEIVDAVSGTVLENSIRRVADKVEAVTGMDFARFTRSTLLAQGGFAAFLEASQNEKAPILEQITGTEIYSSISIKVHELRSEEQTRLEELHKTIKHITFLDADEESELIRLIREKTGEGSLLKTTISGLRTQAAWLQGIGNITVHLAGYAKQLEVICNEEQSRTKEFQKLQPAMAAQKIEPLYLEQQNLRKAQNEAVAERQHIKKQLSSLEKHKQEQQDQCETAVTLLLKNETEQETGLELISRVQKLDHTLESSRDTFREHQKQLTKRQQLHNKGLAALQTIEQQHIQALNNRKMLDEFFKSQAGDERLIESFEAIGIQIRAISEIHDQAVTLTQSQQTAVQNTITRKEVVAALQKQQSSAQAETTATTVLLRKLTLKIEELLQENDPAFLQQELFQTQNRQKAVQELQLFLKDHAKQTQHKETLQQQLSDTKTHQQQTVQKLLLQDSKLAEKIHKVELMETNRRLLIRIQTLEEDRKQLSDGTPCPLCGSIEHPYQTSKIPGLSQEETKLRKVKDELQEIEKEHTELTRLKTVDGELQNNLSRQLKELQQSTIKLKKTGAELLSRLDFPVLEELDHGDITREEQNLISRKQLLEQKCIHLEKLNKEHRRAKEKNDTLAETVQKLDKELLAAEHFASSASQEENRIVQQEKELAKKLTTLSDNLFLELSGFGLNEKDTAKLPAILDTLEKRVVEWKNKKKEEIDLSARLISLDAEITHRQKLHKDETQEITEHEKHCSDLQNDFAALQKQRSTLLGSKDTEKERKRFELVVKKSRKALTLLQQKLSETEKQLTGRRTLEDRLQKEQHLREKTLSDLDKQFQETLLDSSFTDLNQFLAARTPLEELEKLEQLHSDLQKRKAALQTLHQDKTAALQLEKEKQLSKEAPEKLNTNIQEQERQLEKLQEQAGAAGEQLRQNDKAKIKSAEQLTAIEQQQKTVSRWNRLHMLIGSADGKKFRNFAQGLTFEMMVNHANTYLGKMNDRYILVRDKEQPLHLNVIDTWQAGEIRSTANLSGGESFLVSLALALGLSRMASRNVRVDSLFLDEGFGTLDEETLESALEALAGLREDNKLIGIISHVGALKERIPLQIEVIPGSGGKSRVKGPGIVQESS